MISLWWPDTPSADALRFLNMNRSEVPFSKRRPPLQDLYYGESASFFQGGEPGPPEK